MRKATVFILILVIAVFTASCKNGGAAEGGNASAEDRSVTHASLTRDEQVIAGLTSDIVEKFQLEKDGVYDVNIYLYRNGEMSDVGGVLGIDAKGQSEALLISGRKEGNISYAWSVSASGIAKFPAVDIDDVRSYASISGANESMKISKGREYVLVYVAFIDGSAGIKASSDETLLLDWDSIAEKTDTLSDFAYVHFVTIRLSDIPGWK